MNVFTIKDLENLSGIKAHTIRIWEQRYNFLKPERTGTNIRYYCGEELKTILNISLLNRYGYKISQIDKMSERELRTRIVALSEKEAQQLRTVNDLIAAMVDMDMEAFERNLDLYISARGIERAINQIVFPFLDRIGILWVTNHILPAQEHLVTNIIRQKLIMGIEGVNSRLRIDKTMLLFLPEGEHHELGLLYVYFLLKHHGARVIYLGADVPLSDIEYVCRAKRPDFLYTHLTGGGSGSFSFEKFLFHLGIKVPEVPLVISGQFPRSQTRNLPANVNLKGSLSEILEFIATL